MKTLALHSGVDGNQFEKKLLENDDSTIIT